jgi:hypothetical protein
MTNFLNPVLDSIHFWAALEWVLARTTGLRRQPDTSLRAAGPAPDWLKELVPPHTTQETMPASHTALTGPAS